MRKLLAYTAFASIALSAALAPSSAAAQMSACVVLSSAVAPFQEAARGFAGGFKGRVEQLTMPADPARAADVLGEISARDCGVVVPLGSSALRFLRLRLPETPLVFAMTLSPAAIESAHGNVTGVFLEPSPEMQLEGLRKILPAARRIGVLYSADTDYLKGLRRAAARSGMEIVATHTPRAGDAIRERATLFRTCDAVLMLPDVVTSGTEVFRALLESSLVSNVPLVALAERHVREGALAALSTDYRANGEQAGRMAERVARGARAAAIAREYSNKAGLIINLKTARRIGVDIPDPVIREAVEVYR